MVPPFSKIFHFISEKVSGKAKKGEAERLAKFSILKDL